MASHRYAPGLHEVGDSADAYLQPDGSWGWSNAGLIAAGEATLLVDTLFDPPLTAEMPRQMLALEPEVVVPGHGPIAAACRELESERSAPDQLALLAALGEAAG